MPTQGSSGSLRRRHAGTWRKKKVVIPLERRGLQMNESVRQDVLAEDVAVAVPKLYRCFDAFWRKSTVDQG